MWKTLAVSTLHDENSSDLIQPQASKSPIITFEKIEDLLKGNEMKPVHPQAIHPQAVDQRQVVKSADVLPRYDLLVPATLKEIVQHITFDAAARENDRVWDTQSTIEWMNEVIADLFMLIGANSHNEQFIHEMLVNITVKMFYTVSAHDIYRNEVSDGDGNS